ncbi:MAG: PQQ-binding-like beta-propeller repeat protein, partial [Tepidisphaeraceae bacterium]
VRIVYHQGRLFQTANDSLYALDAQTGKRQWVYRDADGHRLLFAAVAPDLDRVFVAVTRKAEGPMNNDWGAWNSRWPGSPLAAIVALELQTGKQVWRNAEMAGPAIGQLVYDEGRLAFFTPSGIGAPAFPDRIIGALDAKSGKLKWSRDYLKDPLPFAKQLTFPGFQFNIALRNGKLYLTNQNGVVEFDADTGEPLKFLALPVNNGRCTRPRLTTQYHLIGFGSFVAGDLLTSVNQNISRGACATGMTPANGMIYLPPTNTSFQCWCFAMLRGWAGYAAEPLWEPLPVAQRTQAGSGAAAPRIVEQVRPAEPVATIKVADGMMGAKSTFEVPVPRFDGEMVRNAWSGNDVLPYPETVPVKAGDLELVAVVNEHRLEARRGERVVWSFVADGRISAAPVVHEGKVCLGSHDGWVSCLDLRDGRVLWRFLAAPNHRKIVAYGQLESSWPVYGVVVHDGLFAVSAGRHPELDGGIYFYGLDPATGQARWDRRLRTVNEPVAGRGARKLPNTIINGPLSVSGGKLVLVSRDMTNEGTPRMGERYQLVIDPHSESQPTMPTRPNVKKTAPAKAKPKAAN